MCKWGTKIGILRYDRYPNYRSKSQIEFKSSLIVFDKSQIRTWSWETITKIFSRSILGEKNPKFAYEDENCFLKIDFRSTSQIGFKSAPNASNTSQIHRSSRKTMETMFSRSILWENNPKYESGVRKSTYCYATDYQPTAQQVKSGLNLLSMLLTHHKYIDQVGKPWRRCFPRSILFQKNPKYESVVRKSTYCYATDYQPTAQQVRLCYILSHCFW